MDAIRKAGNLAHSSHTIGQRNEEKGSLCYLHMASCAHTHAHWLHLFHSSRSLALLNRSSLFKYTCRLLTSLCLLRFIISLIGTPRSLLDVT